MTKTHTAAVVLPLLVMLSACEVGPDYMRPAAPVPTMFRENAGWMPASPQQAAGWENWWAIYDDPVLDVLEKEAPGGNNPLLKMDNVILTAHVASATARFDPARRRRVGQELSLVLSGKWPMSCVNPSVLAAGGLKRWQPVSMERGPNS